MRHRDNWGWKARIGQFIVDCECVPEAEWWAMAPEGVSVHAARVTAKAPWATWTAGRAAVELAPDVQRGAEQFARMQLSSVVIGQSSSSIAGGTGWDQAVVARLSEILPPDTRATTNGLDCQAALRALGIAHPFLVFPPWFGESFLPQGVAYFGDAGFGCAGHMRADPGRGWRDLEEARMYPEGLGFAQDVEALYGQVRAACPPAADGVLFVGTGLRCVGIIEALEQDLGRPVVTANQASLWHALKLAGVGAGVEGYGRLLRRT